MKGLWKLSVVAASSGAGPPRALPKHLRFLEAPQRVEVPYREKCAGAWMLRPPPSSAPGTERAVFAVACPAEGDRPEVALVFDGLSDGARVTGTVRNAAAAAASAAAAAVVDETSAEAYVQRLIEEAASADGDASSDVPGEEGLLGRFLCTRVIHSWGGKEGRVARAVEHLQTVGAPIAAGDPDAK
eukprot:TRINITY_DN74818_c0_g1_i1.p1 TRINITY_DN74818_c0_g1~~TRINITY_DN74818_c0_g1_i1.p1  ORF type:complete len:206 (+),score=41.72 TRINITY_DN74818_c0_g1_i1:62-619(+)